MKSKKITISAIHRHGITVKFNFDVDTLQDELDIYDIGKAEQIAINILREMVVNGGRTK